ncbi:MAG: Hsp20/alpha crystallin family protein [Ekhidna sp.]
MKINDELIRTLAESADIVNTVNGGTIYPTFETYTEDDHYRLEVDIPSIDPQNIKVEVEGADLLIYQNVQHNDLTLPNLLGMVKISANVSLNHISAGYEDDMLVVIMPFDESAGGFRRDIDILRN